MIRRVIGEILVILSLVLLLAIIGQFWKIVLGIGVAYVLLLIGGYILHYNTKTKEK